jgi:hypothetical protein
MDWLILAAIAIMIGGYWTYRAGKREGSRKGFWAGYRRRRRRW